MMQETVTAGTSKIILTSREELEGCIYAAVRTIIPELANYKAPAEEAADALTLEAAINFLEGLGTLLRPVICIIWPITNEFLIGKCGGVCCSAVKS